MLRNLGVAVGKISRATRAEIVSATPIPLHASAETPCIKCTRYWLLYYSSKIGQYKVIYIVLCSKYKKFNLSLFFVQDLFVRPTVCLSVCSFETVSVCFRPSGIFCPSVVGPSVITVSLKSAYSSMEHLFIYLSFLILFSF